MMNIRRRLQNCRLRGPVLGLIVFLPILGLTWSFLRADVTFSNPMNRRRLVMFPPGRLPFVRGNNLSQANVEPPRKMMPGTHTNITTSSTSQQNSSIYTSPDVFEKRKRKWMDVCAKNPSLKGSVHGVFPHISGVLYCFVPKAGCTFWKQVFNFANAKPQDKMKYKTPWDYPRLFVHNNGLSKGRPFAPTNDFQKFPMRVVVSRDPFSRIISSYLDKFYLPDFWLDLGRNFKAKEALRGGVKLEGFFVDHFKDIAKRFKHTYQAGNTKECGSHLTFAQFLRNSLDSYEPHWLPVHTICNPCKLKPTHVVTMETFTSDARVIMNRMGIDEFLDGFDPVEQTNTEIETIVEYNFDRVFTSGQKKYAGCISKEELAYRLWTNFQWRGYIHPSFNYTIPAPGSSVIDDLLAQLANAREAAIKDPASCKKFKNDFKIQTFKSIDKTLFESLVKKFEMDTLLFGHENFIEKMRSIYT